MGEYVVLILWKDFKLVIEGLVVILDMGKDLDQEDNDRGMLKELEADIYSLVEHHQLKVLVGNLEELIRLGIDIKDAIDKSLLNNYCQLCLEFVDMLKQMKDCLKASELSSLLQ